MCGINSLSEKELFRCFDQKWVVKHHRAPQNYIPLNGCECTGGFIEGPGISSSLDRVRLILSFFQEKLNPFFKEKFTSPTDRGENLVSLNFIPLHRPTYNMSSPGSFCTILVMPYAAEMRDHVT